MMLYLIIKNRRRCHHAVDARAPRRCIWRRCDVPGGPGQYRDDYRTTDRNAELILIYNSKQAGRHLVRELCRASIFTALHFTLIY